MAKTKRFKALLGGHVSIFVPWRPESIEIAEGEKYETDDRREIEALQDSPEVAEVKETKKSN